MKLIRLEDMCGKDIYIYPEWILWMQNGGTKEGRAVTEVHLPRNMVYVFGTPEENAEIIRKESDPMLGFDPREIKFYEPEK